MITKAKEYKLLEVHDIEEAVSQYFGKPVKVSQMEVMMYDWISEKIVYFEIFVPEVDEYSSCCSFQIQDDMHLWNGVRLNELYLKEQYIFAFDTSLFKSYSRQDCLDKI